MTLRWSANALADLNRFSNFLEINGDHRLAVMIAAAIKEKTGVLEEFPMLGRPIDGDVEFRELVFHALGGNYTLIYRFRPKSDVVILRVFHSREKRE